MRTSLLAAVTGIGPTQLRGRVESHDMPLDNFRFGSFRPAFRTLDDAEVSVSGTFNRECGSVFGSSRCWKLSVGLGTARSHCSNNDVIARRQIHVIMLIITEMTLWTWLFTRSDT